MSVEDMMLISSLERQIDLIEDHLFQAQDQLKQLRADYYEAVNKIIEENR